MSLPNIFQRKVTFLSLLCIVLDLRITGGC